MNGIEERYISLLTDFGFKRIFGTAPNRVMGTGTLVHSLGSMNLSPMILSPMIQWNSNDGYDVLIVGENCELEL